MFAINATIRRTGGRADSLFAVDTAEVVDLPLDPDEFAELRIPSDELLGRDGGRFPLKKSPNWY